MKATQAAAGKGLVSITLHTGKKDVAIRKAVHEGKYGVVVVFTRTNGELLDYKPSRDMATGSKASPSYPTHDCFNDLAEAKEFAEKVGSKVVNNPRNRTQRRVCKYRVNIPFSRTIINIEAA